MSRACQITGKRGLAGNRVSHSNRKTRHVQNVNVHTKRLLNPATGRMKTVKLSTRALRTLKKWNRDGKVYVLNLLVS